MVRIRSPYIKIILSFALVILTGTILLVLPFSTRDGKGLSFIDALFTATSSVCVTGLSVVPNLGTMMTVYGKTVICLLIEIGGLSILTFTMFVFVLLRKKVGIADRYLMKEALNQHAVNGIVRLIKSIVITTFSIQIIGALLLWIPLCSYYPVGKAFALGIFHAVSCFNNAGLDIFGYTTSLIPFKNDVFFLIITMLLIIIGGIGYVVLFDVFRPRKKYHNRFSLLTKIVVPTTIVLIVVGMLLIKFSDYDNISWFQAIFQSVTSRTAGFATYDMARLSNSGFVTMLMLMLIGGSPCSTAGGLKTTTLFVLLVTIFNYARGRSPTAFRRRISPQSVFRAFSLLATAIVFIFTAVLVLTFIEPDFTVNQIIFECVSAFGTVGLSMGITPALSIASKIIITIVMFTGRLGLLTLISIWNHHWLNSAEDNLKYVEEKVIIG